MSTPQPRTPEEILVARAQIAMLTGAESTELIVPGDAVALKRDVDIDIPRTSETPMPDALFVELVRTAYLNGWSVSHCAETERRYEELFISSRTGDTDWVMVSFRREPARLAAFVGPNGADHEVKPEVALAMVRGLAPYMVRAKIQDDHGVEALLGAEPYGRLRLALEMSLSGIDVRQEGTTHKVTIAHRDTVPAQDHEAETQRVLTEAVEKAPIAHRMSLMPEQLRDAFLLGIKHGFWVSYDRTDFEDYSAHRLALQPQGQDYLLHPRSVSISINVQKDAVDEPISARINHHYSAASHMDSVKEATWNTQVTKRIEAGVDALLPITRPW